MKHGLNRNHKDDDDVKAAMKVDDVQTNTKVLVKQETVIKQEETEEVHQQSRKSAKKEKKEKKKEKKRKREGVDS